MSTDRVASVSVDRDLRLLNKLLHMTGSFTIEFIKGKSRSNPYSIEDAIEFIDRVRIENLYDAISISKVDISETDILCMDDIVVDNFSNNNTVVMDTIDYKYDETYSNTTASDDEVVEYSEYADRIHVIERKACRSIKRVSSSKVITDDTSNTKLLYTIIMLLFIISISIAVFITIVLIK
jgi:hypothetical protein